MADGRFAMMIYIESERRLWLHERLTVRVYLRLFGFEKNGWMDGWVDGWMDEESAKKQGHDGN